MVIIMVGNGLTVATTSVLEAAVHPLFVASTQYEVVTEMPGVVNEVPVPTDKPPVTPSYQLIVPADAVAPNNTVPVPQRAAGVVPVMVGVLLIVTRKLSSSLQFGVVPVASYIQTVCVTVIGPVITVPPSAWLLL